MAKPDVILFEACNFVDYPVGGTLSFAQNMMKAFGNRLALVGISTDDTPVGRWCEKDFGGTTHLFFSIGRRRANHGKPLCPLGIRAYIDLRRHRKAILSLGVRNAFTGGGIALIAVYKWGWESVCTRSPGLRNPGDLSRYWYGKAMGRWYIRTRTRAMGTASVILAAADDQEIDEFAARTRGSIDRSRIVHFPTRVDTSVFKPVPSGQARDCLELPHNSRIFVTCGRISEVKGWDLILGAFSRLVAKRKEAMLVYVGDGEDRTKLESEIRKRNLTGQVLITGFLDSEGVARYLNAADVFVMGSHWEGWPTAMVEALACGKPIVSTDIRAASTLVREGQNGYIVGKRDEVAFATAVERAAELAPAHEVSLRLAENYALKHLKQDLSRLWPVLAD